MEKNISDQVQLTAGSNSHRLKVNMEAQDEVAQEKDTKTTDRAPESEEVAKVRKAWQEANKRRERSGRSATTEEKRAQEKFIKAGVKPPEEALPPKKIEAMLLAPNSGAQVEALIAELKLYEKTGAVTAVYVGHLEAVINALIVSHKVPVEEGRRLLDEAQAMAIKQMGGITGGAEIPSLGQDEEGSGEERPPTATGGPRRENEGSPGAQDAAAFYQGRDTFLQQRPDLQMQVQEEKVKILAGSNLPQGMTEEQKATLAEETASTRVYNANRPKENMSNREIRAAEYEKNYIKAQQDIHGKVDRNGRVIGPGKSMKELKEDLREGEKNLQELIVSLKEEGTVRDFIELMAHLEDKSWEREVQEVLKETNEAEFRKKLDKIVNTAEDTRAIRLMHERSINPPNSIQEIAQDIVGTDAADFRTGGKYGMFKRVMGEDGSEHMKFQKHHFIEWARYKMKTWDKENPDDTGDMFKIVGIFGTSRGVSLGEMMLVPGFFRDRDTEEFLEDLRTALVYEAWRFNDFRNFDIQYRTVKGSDEDLAPKALQPIYDKNTATKGDVLNTMFNMSDVMEQYNSDEQNSKTGQAVRMALSAYYNLTDRGMLEKMMKNENGELLAFFDNKKFLEKYLEGQMYKNNKEYTDDVKEFMRKYSRILFRQRNGDALTSEENGLLANIGRGNYGSDNPTMKDAKKYVDDFFKLSRPTSHLFDSNGRLKLDKDGKPRVQEFMNASNIFATPQTKLDILGELRERIKLSIMERFGIDYDSADYAELSVYKMTRWTGIAARNDTTSTGFDSWSKVMNTGYYAQHQSSDRRGGAYGNKYNMYQFKRVGLDFFTGITADSGISILEYMQGGQGGQVDFSKQANVMTFGENTMSQFYSNHIIRTFNVFHDLIESKALKLHEIVNTDQYGRVHYDSAKFNEMVRDKFLKDMRYPWATWTGIDFTEEVEMFEEDVNDKGVAIGTSTRYVSRPIARHMFGKEMFNGKYAVMLEYEDLDKTTRLDAKRYFQIEKRLNALSRNGDAAKSAGLEDATGLSLDEKIRNDTENALTQEEKDFLIRNKEWFYSSEMGQTRDIVQRMDEAFVGSGRRYFWKEAAKVRLAAELKEARKRFGNVQTMMSFEETEKFLRAIDQLDANVLGSEDDFGSPMPQGRVFTEEDIAWIREKSGTQFWRMGLEDVGTGMAYGSVEGAWKALVFLFSNMTK